MKEFEITCNCHTWKVMASSIEVAVRKVIIAEKRRLKDRGKEIGKRLTLNKLEIYWNR